MFTIEPCLVLFVVLFQQSAFTQIPARPGAADPIWHVSLVPSFKYVVLYSTITALTAISDEMAELGVGKSETPVS